MIHSMTGFGRGRASANGITATVEVRSVNKRHIDVSVRGPHFLAAKETDVETLITSACERGYFKVDVDVEALETELPVELNEAAAARAKELLERLRTATQIEEPVSLDHVLQFQSEIFATAETPGDVQASDAWPAVEAALGDALDALQTMRRREGDALRTDLDERVDAIEAHLNAVEERAPERVRERQSRLRERLDELVGDDRIDPDRLETEIALLADKLDVTEECVRLHSHVDMFREALDDDEPTGRRLKFITQEIHREVNTIGAKANDEAISRRAVQMKEDVEKIREQIRNVE